MEKFIPPKLDKDIACIVSHEADRELVARVSCYLNKPGVYTPMFRLPRAESLYKKDFSPNDDSFFSDIIVGKSSRLILNSIARIHCQRVILIGLDEIQKSFLNLEKYFRVEFIEINTISELDEKLKYLGRSFDGYFYCRKNDIVKGLVHSIRSNKLLVVDESAPSVSSFYNNAGEGVIVLETENDISEIITVNYACSIKADIKFVQSYHHVEIKELKQKLYKWKKEASYGAYLSFSNTILDSLIDVEYNRYKYATFFTDGIPYGVILNHQVPCSHVLRSISVDIFLFNNILYEENNSLTGSAVIFSPQPEDLGDQAKAEVKMVNTVLAEMKFYNKNLLERNATVKAFDNYVGNYPFDVLHICSHGGKIDGYYVIQEFHDRNGKQHTVEFEEIVGFSPDGREYGNVARKIIYRFFDGFAWRSEELEKQDYPQYVYKDMLKSIYGNEKNIIRTKVDYLVEDSCHVQCHDDIHQGQFNSIASHGVPFIFNNSCTSWEEFAVHLIAAGCRAYIGTLWNISNVVAVNSSTIFYNHVFKSTILDAVQTMMDSIDNDQYKDIYIFCGLHFSTIKKSSSISRNNVREELLIAMDRWIRYTMEKKPYEFLDSALRIIKFLNIELAPFYSNSRVMKALIGSSLFIQDLEERLGEMRQKNSNEPRNEP